MIHFARYSSVHWPIFTSNCPIFLHNISLNQIICQTTYRTWWKYIDTFCSTCSCAPYSFSFPLHWPSSTLLQPGSLTSVLAESIQERLVRHSHPAALGFPDPPCHCLALYQIQHQLRNLLRCHLDDPSGHSSIANCWCTKCVLVHYPHHFWLADSWLLIFSPGKAGGRGDLSENMNTARPSCWKFDHDALTISSVSEIYATVDICFFRARDTFCVAHWFWLPSHISKKLWTFASLKKVLCFASHIISELFSVCIVSNAESSFADIALLACDNVPYNDCFTKGLACGFWLPPAHDIHAKGKTGPHSDTKCCDWHYVACHSSETGVLWVRWLVLAPTVGDICQPQCTVNLQSFGVTITEIRINLPPVLWWCRRWIQIEPGGRIYWRCMIASSGCRLIHIARCWVFVIIAGHIKSIKGRLTGSWSRCRGEEIVAQYAFGFNDCHMLMFGTVFILHILQQCILVLGSIGSVVISINIHSLVPRHEG